MDVEGLNTPLEKQLYRVYPDFLLIGTFPTALPLWRVRLAAKVRVPQPISTIAQFVLRAIGLGQDTSTALSELLGIDQRDIADACADLLEMELIDLAHPEGTDEHLLKLSVSGKAWIDKKAATLAPQIWSFDLHYEPLSARLIPRQDAARRLSKLDRELFTLPHMGTPLIDMFDPEQVQEGARTQEAGRTDITVISLLEMEKPSLEYLTDVRVVILRDAGGTETRFAAFVGAQHSIPISEGIDRAFARHAAVVPPSLATEIQQKQAESSR